MSTKAEDRKKLQIAKFEINRLVRNTLISRRSLLDSMLDGTNRDLNKELHYPDSISADLYKEMYDREGIAARVVELSPQESWSVDPRIIENEEVENTTFEKAWRQLQKKLNLYAYLERADELSGIGHFGVILLGVGDGKELHDPAVLKDDITKGSEESQNKLLFVRTFPEHAVEIDAFENDPTNPRFGLPTFYNIKFTDRVSGNSESPENKTSKKVHWTRIIHLADNRQSSEVFGTPRMKNVFNRLLDLRKVLGGSGEMFWKGAFPGYSFEVDPRVTDGAVELDTKALREEFERYSNSMQRYIALTGVSAKSLAPQVSDPGPHMVAFLKAIAITKGIPWRILLGSEEAKLASTQDKDTWRERVKYRQHKYLTPWVITPFIDRLIELNILPPVSDEDEGYTVVWPDMAKQTDKEKAEVAARKTEALAKYVVAGVDTLIPPREYFIHVLGTSPEEADALIKAAESFIGDSVDGNGIDDGDNDDEENNGGNE